jgi:hypothetical protein
MKREFSSLLDVARQADQSGDFEEAPFLDGLRSSLAEGAFRLVLVLDEAPDELVQLVGYLESISSQIKLDLITVSAYEAGGEQILVPQRVDPDYVSSHAPSPSAPATGRPDTRRKTATTVDGSQAFEDSIEQAAESDRPALRQLLSWARDLETRRLAVLKTVLGSGRQILLVWVPGQKAGLVSIWNDGGAYVSLWRTVFVRLAWNSLEDVERAAGAAIGQGTTIRDPSTELLDAVALAYTEAAGGQSAWNGRDFYVAFGENDQRHWDDARAYGFISAGGGDWYSKTLRQLSPGNRVFVYIPKGNGVGGYVGCGEVSGEPRLARDFMVEAEHGAVPYLDVASAPMAGQNADDEALAEWVVPVHWLDARPKEDAVKDKDFFANQNTAVKLTHGYTLSKLEREFDVTS